jgi:AcrR family transcriptional regulator
MTETKDKILDIAERLFGQQGYAATSLRQIIGEAGVNLAAVHYHFGSKEELLDALVMRKALPVNAERLALLDQVEAEAGAGPLDIAKVIRAFLEPPFSRMKDHPALVKMMGRLYAEGLMPMIVAKHFQPVVIRFFAALRRAVPQLTEQELTLRIRFMVGAMAHTMFEGPILVETGPAPDWGTLLEELVAFLSGGFRAPVQGKEKSRTSR